MKVSYNWLQTYFNEGEMPSVEALTEKFTFHIFEVDGVEEVDGDSILDLDILPNRAHDCLGHRGVAHEVAALFDLKLKDDPLRIEPSLGKESSKIKLIVDDSNVNPTHVLALIEGVKVGPSPQWLKKSLEAIGQRSINNIVDATNYIMYSLGQPSHVFDFDKLAETEGVRGVRVRAAKEGEELTLLGGKEIALTSAMNVLSDAQDDTPLDVAGVKGGVHAELDEGTTNVILTCAKFHPIITRKAAQALKIRTDASARYENELPNQLPLYGIHHLVKIILELAGGELEGFAVHTSEQIMNKGVTVTMGEVEKLIGLQIPTEIIAKIFTQLEFSYTQDGDTFTVTAPWERLDITSTADLIEEVARVHGYKHVPDTPLPALDDVPISKKYYYIDTIRSLCEKHGFTEVYLHALNDSGELALKNSLNEEKDHYRNSLKNGLKKVLVYNAKNAPIFGSSEGITLFEVGNVYVNGAENTHIVLGVEVLGKKKREERTKEAMREVVSALEELLHTTLPEIVDGVIEFDLDALLDDLETPSMYGESDTVDASVIYTPISPYPFINRDIAMWAPEDVDEKVITSVIEKHGGELVQRIDKFDEFAKGGRVSLAFHIIFQSMERTLTDDEVGQIMKKVETELGGMEGFEVR